MANPASHIEAIRGIVKDIGDAWERKDSPAFGESLLVLINFLWPEMTLYSFQEFIILKAFERTELFLEMTRGGGKSWIVALITIIKKLLWPGRVVIYSGPTYRQAKHPFHFERDLLMESPYLTEMVRSTRGESGITTEAAEQAEITYVNGSRSVGLPASGTKIHGERGSDVIITEAFEYPKLLFTRSVSPMLRGAKKYPGMPRTIIFETTAGYQDQWMYAERRRIIERMQAGDPKTYFISYDEDDLTEFGYPPGENVEEEKLRDYDVYLQQFKNRWLTTMGTFYNLALLANTDLRRAEVEFQAKPGFLYVAGLDVAWSENQDAADSAFTVWRIPLSGQLPDITQPPQIIFVETWHAAGTTRQTNDVATLLKQFDISLLVVDAQGAGVDVVMGLKKAGFAEIGDENSLGRRILLRYPHTSPILNEDHNSFKAAIINKAVSLPQQPELTDPNRDNAQHVYNLVATGLKQGADLKTKELSSGYLHFETPSSKKSDIFMSILYGWHGVRLKMEQPESKRRSPGVGLIGMDIGL